MTDTSPEALDRLIARFQEEMGGCLSAAYAVGYYGDAAAVADEMVAALRAAAVAMAAVDLSAKMIRARDIVTRLVWGPVDPLQGYVTLEDALAALPLDAPVAASEPNSTDVDDRIAPETRGNAGTYQHLHYCPQRHLEATLCLWCETERYGPAPAVDPLVEAGRAKCLARLMLSAPVLPNAEFRDWLVRPDPEDAADLGLTLGTKGGKPCFAGYSDIRNDEIDDMHVELLARALRHALAQEARHDPAL